MSCTSSGITSDADLPHFHRFFRKFRSHETVMPMPRAVRAPSIARLAAASLTAGVMPVT